MFKQMMTLFRGQANVAMEEVAARNALVILDQQMRESGAAIRQAQRALAFAMAEDRQEETRLTALSCRILGLEEAARAALAGGRADLALAAATTIAELEIDQASAASARAMFGAEIARLQGRVREAERRMVEINRGRRLARVGEAVRQTRAIGGALQVDEAEATLLRLRDRQALETVADEAFTEVLAAPKAIEVRLGEAGFGEVRPTAARVLARLQPLAIDQA